jgi:hypothetical protein
MHDVNQVLSPDLTGLAPPFVSFHFPTSYGFNDMSHSCVNFSTSPPPLDIPTSMHLTNQAKLQHCDDRNTLSSSPFPSFIIQCGIIFTMPSREITGNSEKKNKFIDILLMKPKTCVADAMRSARFTKEDITNLRIQCFLQRALLGGLIKGLKAYVAGPRRSRQFRSSRPLVDNAAIVANVEEAPSSTSRVPPLSLSIPLSTLS